MLSFRMFCRPKRRFGTRSTQHLANNNGSNTSTPTATTTSPTNTSKMFVPKSVSTTGVHIQQPSSTVATNSTAHMPLAALQKQNISLISLPNVVEGVAMGSAGFSSASSPTAPTAPAAIKAKGGGSVQSIYDTIDPKSFITEDEPTTEWTPEIPFKNVSHLYHLSKVLLRLYVQMYICIYVCPAIRVCTFKFNVLQTV